MRFLILILSALFLVSATPQPGATNLLKNWQCEAGKTRFTASGGTFTTTKTDNGFDDASCSWDSSGSAQTLVSEDVAITKGLEGRHCLAWGQYKYGGSSGDITVRIELADGTDLTTEIDLSDTLGVWTDLPPVPFMCPDAAEEIRIVFESKVADPAVLLFDELHLGSDIREVVVSQATPWGSLTIGPNTNCLWGASNDAFASMGVDADCSTQTATGQLEQADTFIAGFKSNFKPGRYIVYASILAGNNGVDCVFKLNDGSTSSGSGSSVSGVFTYQTIVGEFEYSTSGYRTIDIFSKRETAVNQCQIDGGSSLTDTFLSFRVVRYPNDVETAIQKPEAQGFLIDANIGRGDSNNFTLGAGAVTDYANGMVSNSSLDLVLNKGVSATIPCDSNPSTGLTCSSGSEQVGLSFSADPGDYRVCIEFAVDPNGGSGNTTFQLVRTTPGTNTIIDQGGSRINMSGGSSKETLNTCGIFRFTSSGTKEIKLTREQSTWTTAEVVFLVDRAAANGQRDIHLTVYKISQQFPSAVLARDVAIGGTTSGCPDGGNICSGSWTPTRTDETNIGSASVTSAKYIRVGSFVYFGLSMTVATAGAGNFEVQISPPISSTFTASTDAFGHATAQSITRMGRLEAETSSPFDIRILGNASTTASVEYSVTGMYEIK